MFDLSFCRCAGQRYSVASISQTAGDRCASFPLARPFLEHKVLLLHASLAQIRKGVGRRVFEVAMLCLSNHLYILDMYKSNDQLWLF